MVKKVMLAIALVCLIASVFGVFSVSPGAAQDDECSSRTFVRLKEQVQAAHRKYIALLEAGKDPCSQDVINARCEYAQFYYQLELAQYKCFGGTAPKKTGAQLCAEFKKECQDTVQRPPPPPEPPKPERECKSDADCERIYGPGYECNPETGKCEKVTQTRVAGRIKIDARDGARAEDKGDYMQLIGPGDIHIREIDPGFGKPFHISVFGREEGKIRFKQTEFGVHIGEEAASVFVFRGAVIFSDIEDHHSMVVGENEVSVMLFSDHVPAEPIPFDPSDYERWWEDTGDQGDGNGGCMIATAAYGTPAAKEIDLLREFRDEVLMTNAAGRVLVGIYYRLSPPVAKFISRHDTLRMLVREALVNPPVKAVEMTRGVWHSIED